MRIGRFAREAGLTTRQVRYYSDKDLLPVMKTANGYREYDSGQIPRAKRCIACWQQEYQANNYGR